MMSTASDKLMTTMLVGPVKKAFRVGSGFGLLGCGMILFLTPGPGWLVVMLALGVLAADFLWARRMYLFLKHSIVRLKVAIFGHGLAHLWRGIMQHSHVHPHGRSHGHPNGHFAGSLFKSNHM
jgi:Putative transmembrane protein (PGPGW)